MFSAIKSFAKRNRVLFILLIVAVSITLSYYISYDIPELISGIEKWYKLFSDLSIEADGDVLPLLFAIDEAFDISIKDFDGEPGIFFSNKNLVQFLKDWQAMKELLDNGSQTQDNYEIWKTIRPSVTKVTHE